MFKSW